MNKSIKTLLIFLVFGFVVSLSILFLPEIKNEASISDIDPYDERNLIEFTKNLEEGEIETRIMPIKEAEQLKWTFYAEHPEVSLNYSPRIKIRGYDAKSGYSTALYLTKISNDGKKYKELEIKTADIINKLRYRSDLEKVFVTKLWIKNRCEYTDKIMNMWDESLYGCLVKGKATCLGYSQGYYYMMKKLHVPCRIVFNKYHAWNEVYLYGKWIKVDLTQ